MKQSIAVLILLLSSHSLACSIARTIEQFESDASGNIEPKPTQFEVSKIARGTDDGNPASCSDLGGIALKAENIPPDTGFIFKIVNGEFQDRLFPEGPVVPSEFYDPNEFVFIWLDDSGYEHEPFDIEVEITPVSKTGHMGEPTILNVSHPGSEKPWWRFW